MNGRSSGTAERLAVAATAATLPPWPCRALGDNKSRRGKWRKDMYSEYLKQEGKWRLLLVDLHPLHRLHWFISTQQPSS